MAVHGEIERFDGRKRLLECERTEELALITRSAVVTGRVMAAFPAEVNPGRDPGQAQEDAARAQDESDTPDQVFRLHGAFPDADRARNAGCLN
jgi:hypothetical protein